MSDLEADFHRLTGELNYPMMVVTTVAGNERSGCLVGFATQCSIHPPRFLMCLSVKNHTYRVARHAEALAVHFLPSTATELAKLFGGETDDQVDKFTRCRWHEGPRGLPILDESQRWFVGAILEQHVLGDHVGFLLDPVAVTVEGSPDLYVFGQARGMAPGHRA